MGLFRKTKEEKEIKRLTGGIFLSDEFKDKLKRDNLEPLDGLNIQKLLKKEVKEKTLPLNEIEHRFNELYNEILNQRIEIDDAFEYNMKLYRVKISNEEINHINKDFREKIFEGKSLDEVKKEINEIVENKTNNEFTEDDIEKRKKELEEEKIKKSLNLDFFRKKDNLILKNIEKNENNKYIYNLTVTEYVNEAKKLENKHSTERAIIIYEKLINEYRYSDDVPYIRLRFIYDKQKRYHDIIRICDLQIENLSNIGYLNGKNLMIITEEISSDNNKLKTIKNIKKTVEIKLDAIKENREKLAEERRKKDKIRDNIEIKTINKKEDKERLELMKERDNKLKEVKKRYSKEIRTIKYAKNNMENHITSIEKQTYGSNISNRKIKEYDVELPKVEKSNTALASTALFFMTGVFIGGAKEEVKWNSENLTLYEDGFRINKKINFEEIIQSSFDNKENKFYFLIKTNTDEIVFRTEDKELLNDLNYELSHYHSRTFNNIRIKKDETDINLNYLNSKVKNIRIRQQKEEESINKEYRQKFQKLKLKYHRLREKKIKELEEDSLKNREHKDETKKRETEENIGQNKKEEEKEEIGYQNSEPEKIIEEIKPNNTKKSSLTTLTDDLELKPYNESSDLEEFIESMDKYDQTVRIYEEEAKRLEKENIDDAIMIYEKIVNEYKFGGNFPYDRLIAIYYKQNKHEEIIRICDLAIENLGHVGYLKGKTLMINPNVTSAGTEEKVKKFKDRKKREKQKLNKSEQKEKERKIRTQNEEKIEKYAKDLELAQYLEKENNINEAIKLYETITKAKYPDKLPYYRLCILYRKKKNYKKELTTCNKAIRNIGNKKQKDWFKERKIKVQEKLDKQETKKKN